MNGAGSVLRLLTALGSGCAPMTDSGALKDVLEVSEFYGSVIRTSVPAGPFVFRP